MVASAYDSEEVDLVSVAKEVGFLGGGVGHGD